MRRTIVLSCALATIAAGCASGGGSGGSTAAASPAPATGTAATASGTAPRTNRKGSSTLITADELAAANVTNAFEAIQRLRPTWLRGRGATSGRQVEGSENPNTLPSLYVDNSPYGDVSQLGNLNIANIAQIQFLSATEATTRWGTNNTGGAILVVTKR